MTAIVRGCTRVEHRVERALEYIHDHFCERLPLEKLAAIAGLSVFRFATVFRRRVGVPPHRYVCQLRVRRAQKLLREGLSTANVANETGFFDQSHLSRHFRSLCGMTPRQYLAEVRRGADPSNTRPLEPAWGPELRA